MYRKLIFVTSGCIVGALGHMASGASSPLGALILYVASLALLLIAFFTRVTNS